MYVDDVAKAETDVVLCMRLWHMASPDRKNAAFVKLLAAQDWLEVVQERAKDLAMVARQNNITTA